MKRLLAGLSCVMLFVSFAACTGTKEQTKKTEAEPKYKVMMDVMKVLEQDSMKLANAWGSKNYDVIAENAVKNAEVAEIIFKRFAWNQDFYDHSVKFRDASLALAEAAKTKDKKVFLKAYAQWGRACGGCH